MHHTLCNTIFSLAQQAGATPQLEPQGLLPESAELRPADILIHSSPSVRASSWQKFPKLALDFAIVSPFAVSILRESASHPLSAASRYADRKRAIHDVTNKYAKFFLRLIAGRRCFLLPVVGREAQIFFHSALM